MAALEIRTTIYLLAVGNAAALAILLAYPRPAGRLEPYRQFMGAKLLQCVAWLLLGLRGGIPDALSIHVGNALVVGGFALEALALATARRAVPHLKAVLATLTGMGLGCFWLFGRTPNLRVSLVSLIALLLLGTGAAVMLRQDHGSRLQRFLGLFYGISCMALGARVIAPFWARGAFTLLTQNPAQTLAFLPLYLLMLGGVSGFLLLIKEQDDLRIRESEEKFASVFRSSPNAILLTRFSDGTVLEVNPSFERLSGYSAEEVVGKTTVAFHLFRDLHAREEVVRQMALGQVRELELVFPKRSGERVTGLLSAELMELQGEPVLLSSISDITERKGMEEERDRMIRELQTALAEVKTLSGLLPICSSCKKIRDDSGYWNQIEHYIAEHSEAAFTHGICPDCARTFFPGATREPPSLD